MDYMSRHSLKKTMIISSVLILLVYACLTLIIPSIEVSAASLHELLPYEVLRQPGSSAVSEYDMDQLVLNGVSIPELNDVMHMLIDGAYQNALSKLEELNAGQTLNDRASYYQILSLCGLKNLPAAEALANQTIKTQMYKGLIDYTLGYMLLNQARFFDSAKPEKASTYLENASSDLPYLAGPDFYLGLAYLSVGKYQEAVDAFNTSNTRNPNFSESYFNMGMALSGLGKTRAAIDALEEAKSLGSDRAQLFMALGDLYLSIADYKKAKDSYTIVVNSPDSYVTARYKLSVALLGLEDFKEASKIADKIVSQQPRHFDAHMVLGAALFGLRDYESAIRAYESALWLRPGHFNARIGIAKVYLAAGNPETAISYIDEAIRIYDGDAEAYYLKAKALEDLGDNIKARVYARKSIQIDPNFSQGLNLYHELEQK